MLKLIVPVLLMISLGTAAALPQAPTTADHTVGTMKTGTAIVVFYSKQRVVLAGESRVVLVGKTVSSRDDECKVSTPSERFLFANSGVAGYDLLPGETGEPWSAQTEASRIAATVAKGATDGVAILAGHWEHDHSPAFVRDLQLSAHVCNLRRMLHSR
jgi:hypothetical protein